MGGGEERRGEAGEAAGEAAGEWVDVSKNTEAVGEEVIEVQKMIDVLEGFHRDESSERKPERQRAREQIVLSCDDAALFVFPPFSGPELLPEEQTPSSFHFHFSSKLKKAKKIKKQRPLQRRLPQLKD